MQLHHMSFLFSPAFCYRRASGFVLYGMIQILPGALLIQDQFTQVEVGQHA